MGRGCAALAVAMLSLSTAPAVAQPCEPTAQVAGDTRLSEEISVALRARGVEVTDEPACREVIAQVEPESERVRVKIVDSHGRRVERLVDDVDGAATTIEAWVRHDISDPLIVAALEPPPPDAVTTSTVVASPSPAARAVRVELGAGLDGGIGSDGAMWGGARVNACVPFRGACIGAIIRYASDSEWRGASEELGNARRSLDLTLEVHRPIRRGRLTISPGIGVGQTAVTASRIDLDQEEEVEQATSLHLAIGTRAGLRLAGATSLHLDVSVLAAPFARTELGDMTEVGDQTLAASSKLMLWVGFGATYEGL